MTRVDLKEGLAVGVVHHALELLGPARPRRRIDTPGGAVGDYDRVVSPLVELSEELGRCCCDLTAIRIKLAHVSRAAIWSISVVGDSAREIAKSVVDEC